MRILVNGLPFFSEKLVRDLNFYDSDNTYIFCDTYTSKWAQIKFALLLPFSGAVISSNGVSARSKSLDLVLRFNKKLIMQWHGTDVKLAVERNQNKTIKRKYIDYAAHIVSAPWFEEELSGILKVHDYAPFGYVNQTGNDNKYRCISILTYLAEGREDFYGWNKLEKLARKHPNLQFKVIGSSGSNFEKLDNVTFLGWVDELEVFRLMQENPIYLRLTIHDGKSISVSQAIGAGCEVIWSYKMEHCHFAGEDLSQLEDKIVEVRNLIEQRGMLPNMNNITFAKEKFNKEYVMNNFVDVLKGALNA